MVAHAELRRARDLYRLTVAFDDTLEAAPLVEIARDLRPIREAGVHDGFEHEIRKLLSASALRIDRVAEEISRQIERMAHLDSNVSA